MSETNPLPTSQSSLPEDVLRLCRRLKQEKKELENLLAEARSENQRQMRHLLEELEIAQHTIQRQQQHIHHLSQELETAKEAKGGEPEVSFSPPWSFTVSSVKRRTGKLVELPPFIRRKF